MPQYPLYDEDRQGASAIHFTVLTDNGTGADTGLTDIGTGATLRSGGSISLYVPNGLTFTDGVSYSNTDLGLSGAAMASVARGGAGEDLAAQLQSALNNFEAGVESSAFIASYAAALAIPTALGGVAGRLFGETGAGAAVGALNSNTLRSGAEFGRGRIFNPNTKALFKSVNIRSFSFQFKMIPVDEREAEEIKSIVKTFRKNMYPDHRGTDGAYAITIKYPNKFLIEIHPGPDNTTDENIIKFKQCFLNSVNVSYNETSHSYFSGGAPVETTLTLTFTEAETLTQQDVEAGF